MTIDAATLAAAFVDAYGAGIDVARAEAAIARALATATCPNEIARRRAQNALAETCLDAGVASDDLTGPSQDRYLCAVRDRLWWELSSQGLSTREIASHFGRCHKAIATGIRRHDLRTAERVPVHQQARGGAR